MRVLLVEDEPKIAAALTKGLTQERYAVDVSHEADEALRFAETEPYDLIILDRMLPGSFDGVELCRRLRQAHNHVPLLMLTAKDAVKDRVEGLNAGADDYLVKPFALEELLARLRTLLRRPPAAHTDDLTLGDLILNTQNFTVTRADKALTLTTTEFALLEYLLRCQGRPVSKEAIISHVWNYDADILPNTVEVYIGYVRAKIDKAFPGAEPLIHTVRGFGYKAALHV